MDGLIGGQTDRKKGTFFKQALFAMVLLITKLD
jgi:hypothetical protein